MPRPDIDQDAIIVGGGFYGAAIAIYLAKRRDIKRILLVEREAHEYRMNADLAQRVVAQARPPLLLIHSTWLTARWIVARAGVL